MQGIELSVMANLAKKIDLGLDFTFNQGEYKHICDDWAGTAFEDDSKYISRFPSTTVDLRIEYSPKTWVFSLDANFQGQMYINYYNEEIDPELGDMSKGANSEER